jgi:hypothetical protein
LRQVSYQGQREDKPAKQVGGLLVRFRSSSFSLLVAIHGASGPLLVAALVLALA